MIEDPEQIWEQCLNVIQKMVRGQTFDTWFKPTKGILLTGETLTIQVPNQFFEDWIEEHHLPIIKQVISQKFDVDLSVAFSIAEKQQKITPIPSRPLNTKSPRAVVSSHEDNPIEPLSNLYDGYTFDNFVVGTCNQYAHAASLAVVESPGKSTFNPLVIYGGVGLGKTHLAQAIAHGSTSRGTVDRLRYVSSEQFTIDFINSIQDKKTKEFAQMYRHVDMLIVDDIQFFCRGHKDQTQEQFFHTFDVLRQNGKQIVLTCDQPPQQLTGLEERLVSRFQWGLLADLQSPDYETRVAILQQKAENDGLEITPEVTAYIADQITSNIRELEGAVLRLLAYSSLFRCDITTDVAKQVLNNTINRPQRDIDILDIQKAVANHFGLSIDLLSAKTRRKEIALARQIAMYLSRKLTDNSLKEIGRRFGGRDHSTVIHACQSIEGMITKDPKFQGTIDVISKGI